VKKEIYNSSFARRLLVVNGYEGQKLILDIFTIEKFFYPEIRASE